MSTPGAGGPQPPEQHPDQPDRLGPWGQQPPAGWGQQPQGGSSAWGGQQPWAGNDNVTRPQHFGPGQLGAQGFGQARGGAPQKPARRWLPVIAGAVGLFVVLTVVRGLLAGDPEAGDCMRATSATEFDTVDCGSDEAEFRILGTDAEMTGEEFDATDPNELCGDFAEATRVFWYGADDADGTVYCAEAV